MLALVKRAPGELPAVEELPDPEPVAGEALVSVRATGICGTDVHILEDVYPHAAPLIPGHEFAGAIVGLGPDVEGWRIGDRVVGELHVGACLSCVICRSGNPQICPSKRALGTWTDGAFAELMRIPAWLLHHIPDDLPDADATLIEPAACVWHGLFERSHLDPGERVLILGHGPIGLLAAHFAACAGAGQVILVGRSRRGTARLQRAGTLGCEVLDSNRQDVAEAVATLTEGLGVDLAVETAGTESSLSLCVRCCRPGGRVVVLGLSGRSTVPLPWDLALLRDLTLSFSFSSRASSWRAVIAGLAAAPLPARTLISDMIALREWSTGFAALRSGGAVKVVLEP